jgi:hypothetical protein
MFEEGGQLKWGEKGEGHKEGAANGDWGKERKVKERSR